MVKKISLTQGKHTKVDDVDFERLSRFKWFFANGYAVRRGTNEGKRTMVWMHRIIAATPDGMVTDHINGDKLDNRRTNLRACTHAQNKWNQGRNSNNTSGFRGVYFDKSSKKWVAELKQHQKHVFLGRFVEKKDAGRAYVEATIKLRGEFAPSYPQPPLHAHHTQVLH